MNFLRLLACFVSFQIAAATDALYLSWYNDPTSTMTIQWHAKQSEALDLLELTAPSGELFLFKAASEPFPNTGLTIYTLKLKNLEADSLYQIQVGEEKYNFKTAPLSLKEELRFVIGGDFYTRPEIFRKMAKLAAAQDPLFAVLGGDLAYAIGAGFLRSSAAKQWHRFLADWKSTMVAPGNRLIPFLIAAGNHDISEEQDSLFFSLFAFPDHRLYRAVDFKSYLSIILLDSGYLTPIGGVQSEWLKKALDERGKVPYVIPVYHEGAYPAFYKPDSSKAQSTRVHWCPLFDEHSIPAAFENHGHVFKVTHPLKKGKIDPKGTTYFGDGCWGVTPRTPISQWYLKEALSKNYFYLITLQPEEAKLSATIDAVGLDAQVFTSFPLSPRSSQ